MAIGLRAYWLFLQDSNVVPFFLVYKRERKRATLLDEIEKSGQWKNKLTVIEIKR